MLRLFLIAVLAGAVALPGPAFADADLSGRVRVIDGDTLDVGPIRVRLFGIDAPELDQNCTTAQGATWACGRWSAQEVTARFQGTWAECEKITIDRYRRVVARCRVKGQDIAEVLVSDGVALAYRRYSMDYDLAEKGAAVNARGLHAGTFETPDRYRATASGGSAAPDATCRLKGNISSKGVRIYHRPGQADYEKTRINPAKGERWFCSEAEAQRAGWRAAKR